jgi:putative addiction module component (TIGR02574 family)
MNTLLEQSLALPIPERIKLVEDIWDSITAEPETLGLTPEQIAEVDRRIDDYSKNPEKLVPWEEARERLRQIA